jgi:CRP/FNR family transcriptional regulator, anaerobic regulatory protein
MHHDRFNELIRTINNIAFSKLDERLYTYLHGKSKALKSKTINITHHFPSVKINAGVLPG